jgi:hypothetical protein
MSIVVSFTPPTADQTLAARQKRAVRRRSLMSAGTLLLITGMAAVPLPVWRANTSLSGRAAALNRWIDEAQLEVRQVAAFLAAGGAGGAQPTDQELERWLAPHDRLATKELLLTTARASGLSVDRAELHPDTDPLSADDAPTSDVTVLGLQVGSGTAPRVLGSPLTLRADRYVLVGTGRVTSLLLFCGVLREMPAPLRLRSVQLEAAGNGVRFSVTIDKLLDALHDS